MDKDCATQANCLIKIIVKFRTEKNLSTFASCAKHSFEEHIDDDDDCAQSNIIKKKRIESLDFSEE